MALAVHPRQLSLLAAVAAQGLRLEVERFPLSSDGLSSQCQCLDWAQVYESGLAECGAGLEHLGLAFEAGSGSSSQCLHKLSRPTTLASAWGDSALCNHAELRKLDTELCRSFPSVSNSSFFRSQWHNYCMKANEHAQPSVSLSWCYVSSECDKLNMGTRINERVSWKMCNLDQDKFLGSLDIPQLCAQQKMMRPDAKQRGGCRLAALKAYQQVQGTLDEAILQDPTLQERGHSPVFSLDLARKVAVVQHGPKRWELHSDWHQHRCVGGC